MMQIYARAQMLISQGRFDMAEKELRQVLGEHPDDGTAHAMLAVCMVQTPSRYQEATETAQRAVVLEPDEAYSHFIHSIVLWKRNHLPEAQNAIAEAIRLDPYDPDYFAQSSQLHLAQRDWQAALDDAESGLEIDPEHGSCNNLRTIALERLGRGDEAVVSASENLKNNPESSYSHSAHGWALLNSGDYLKAQDSFREALRLDPTNQAASDGMIDAISSRNILFRVMRKFNVWISRLSHKYQFAIIFGAWILVNVLSRVGGNVPWLAPLVPLILMAYMAFAVLTWTSESIFNTLLRFHPFGRHLLTPKLIWRSNLIASCLISGLIGSIATVVLYDWYGAIVVAFYWMLMCAPIVAAFAMPTLNRALIIGGLAVVVGLIPAYGVFQSVMAESTFPLASSFRIFIWSVIGIQIGANFMAVAPNRQ